MQNITSFEWVAQVLPSSQLIEAGILFVRALPILLTSFLPLRSALRLRQTIGTVHRSTRRQAFRYSLEHRSGCAIRKKYRTLGWGWRCFSTPTPLLHFDCCGELYTANTAPMLRETRGTPQNTNPHDSTRKHAPSVLGLKTCRCGGGR